MKIALLIAAALIPALASADDKPYAVYNGRGAGTTGGPPPAAPAPAAAPAAQGSNQLIGTALAGGAFGTSGVAPGLIPGLGGSSGQGFSGRRGAARGFGGFKRSLHGRRVDSAPTGSGGSASEPPPYYSKPGALIRTEGQLPKYEQANGGGTTSVEGGSFVQIDPRRALDVGKAPGITWAPPDKLPGANPTAGAGGGSGASSNPGGNTTIINNGAHDNTNGGGGNSNNGNGNGNGGQGQSNSTGFNPAF